jgi:hypothetical protein
MENKDNFLKQSAEILTPLNSPPPRFGHTVNLVSKTTVVVFGGAISSPGNYTMTADLYLYNIATNSWKKLERNIIITKNYSFEHRNDTSCQGSSRFCYS